MADKLIHSETLAEIAAAIRIKNEAAGTMSPGQMAALILQTGFGNVPGYHDLEACRVADKIRRLRDTGVNLLVFGAMADSHVHVGTNYEALTKISARHAAFALENVSRWTQCMFLANLGDNCWGTDLDSPEDAAAAAYLDGCITTAFTHLRSYRLVGECDRSSDPQKVYALNGAHNVFDVSAATARRGFGYTDDPVHKVRLIVLNTSDCCGTEAGYGMSYEQKAFLMYALDLSGKSDTDQWQILILSHYPLDYPGDSRYNTAADVRSILSAYVSGQTVQIPVSSAFTSVEKEDPAAYAFYSGGNLVCGYGGKNAARIIANIHGHVHNASFGTMEAHGITRVSTPNACFYRENGSVEELYTVDASAPKTETSAEDTAVTFYAVDLDNHVIHAFAYGAGADREIAYV